MTPLHNPRYVIVTAISRHALVTAVDPKLIDGVWECSGAPFLDEAQGVWCQALVRRDREARPGEVNLREPKRRGVS